MKRLTGVLVAFALAGCGGSSSNSLSLTTSAAINAYLDGKTMVMTGSNIPPYPNGFNANENLGASTQCYNKTTISILSGTWNVTSALGTLNGATTVGAVGTCDTSTVSGSPVSFSSTAVGITNVTGNATCFDISVTYSGFAQEGRGSISADGKTVTLELFFAGQDANATCANGPPGTAGVTVTPPGGAPSTLAAGASDQVYVVQ